MLGRSRSGRMHVTYVSLMPVAHVCLRPAEMDLCWELYATDARRSVTDVCWELISNRRVLGALCNGCEATPCISCIHLLLMNDATHLLPIYDAAHLLLIYDGTPLSLIRV